MITTMDSAGRLVTPREIRREASLEPGTPLEVRWRDGVIEIESRPRVVTRPHSAPADCQTAYEDLDARFVERRTHTARHQPPQVAAVRSFALDANGMGAAVSSWHEHHRRATRELERHLARGERLVVPATALIEIDSPPAGVTVVEPCALPDD